MATWQSLVRDIRCAPDEDAPRRAAAAWLRDRGDKRGDYIERALRGDADDPESEQEWAKPVAKLAPNNSFTFTRGFIEALDFAEDEAANFRACCKLEPITRIVLRYTPAKLLRSLATAPELEDLRALCLSYPEGPCATLLRSPRLARVEDFAITDFGPAEIDALCRGVIRPRKFEYNAVIDDDPETLARLVDAGFFACIEDLKIVAMSDELVEVLARAPLSHLRRLELATCAVSDAAYASLGPRLDQLEELVLNDASFGGSSGAVAIAHMTSGKLRRLECYGHPDEGFTALIKSRAFRNVEDLYATGGLDANALQSSKHRKKLRKVIVMRKDGLDLPGVEIIVDD